MQMLEQWKYREQGSRDRKTGRLKYYSVTVTDFVITDCECEARQFRQFTNCKHMKRLQEKATHFKLK